MFDHPLHSTFNHFLIRIFTVWTRSKFKISYRSIKNSTGWFAKGFFFGKQLKHKAKATLVDRMVGRQVTYFALEFFLMIFFRFDLSITTFYITRTTNETKVIMYLWLHIRIWLMICSIGLPSFIDDKMMEWIIFF